MCLRAFTTGTSLAHPSECFVHWHDAGALCEWGLNFTTPADARRFLNTCSVCLLTYDTSTLYS